jgi:hypothetical protein
MHISLETYKHYSARRLSLALFIVNLIGAIVYVGAASPSWAIPQERGLHSTTGEPFVWAAFVLPIFAGFTLLNLLWGIYICVGKRWRDGYFLLVTAANWLIAVWIDFAHH